jgi:3-hydroxyisobutyrate dehydrogenase
MRVHVLGAGRMGLPMARHLREGGHALSVSDPTANDCASRERRSSPCAMRPPASPRPTWFLSSLPDDTALLAVAQQVARHARHGTTWIDTSTVSPTASAQAAKACAEAGVRHLRATVSGNNHMAEAAQLTVMGSGPRASYDAMLPLLRLLGRRSSGSARTSRRA